MAHPMAGQAQASQRRRLSALGAKAGKSFGSSSMYKKHAYPRERAGSDTPMTISGGPSRKRADRKPAKYADGGRIVGEPTPDSPTMVGPSPTRGNRPNRGGRRGHRSKNVTNVIIADRGGGGPPRDRPVPVPVARPVPVPVGAAPMARRPVVAAPAAAPPAAAPPAMPPAMPPRGPGMPGLAGGGLASPQYHNWGGGYKAGGVVKKANGGFLRDQSPDGYKGYPHSPTSEVDDAVSAKKDGGAIRKAAFGGLGRRAMTRRARPGSFQPAPPPGSVQPGRGGPAIVPLTGGARQRPGGGLGFKKGGKAEDEDEGYKKGGAVHSDEAQDRKLIKKMINEEERSEKKADGGVVKTPITNATGGGAGGKARLKKTSAAKDVPAVTEDKSSASAAGHNPAPRGMAGSAYHQQGKGVS